jgi:hypothetical protein
MSIFTCCEREDETKYLHTCGCPSASVSCESEQVNATLCGHSEYSGDGNVPSTPPKKYRLETDIRSFGGFTRWKCCQPSFIDPYERQLSFQDTNTGNFISTVEYDAITCAISSNSTSGTKTRTNYQYCDGSSTGTSNSTYNNICGGYISNVTNVVTSNTLKSSTCSNSGNFNSSDPEECDGLLEFTLNGSGTIALSTEDTEEDAISRKAPVTGTSCSSLWETRSTGFSFTKRTSGYTIECDDLAVGVEYSVIPSIKRRTAVIGSYGAWEDVTISPTLFTATATTETIDSDGNPIALDHIQGYEYQITGVTIEKAA